MSETTERRDAKPNVEQRVAAILAAVCQSREGGGDILAMSLGRIQESASAGYVKKRERESARWALRQIEAAVAWYSERKHAP